MRVPPAPWCSQPNLQPSARQSRCSEHPSSYITPLPLVFDCLLFSASPDSPPGTRHRGRKAAMGLEGGQPWTTVPARRRQRRRPAAASEGERTSDGSSAGSVTPNQAAADEEPEVLSMHPEAAHVLMRAASDEPIASPRLDDEQLLAAAEAPAASPGSTASSAKPLQPAAQRQRQQSKQRSGRQQAQQGLQQAQQHWQAQQAGQQQQRQQVPLLPLPRQDSRSASDLAGMGKAPLRSAKSDLASLTVQTARSSTASGKAGGGAAAAAVSLEGIPETARGGSPLAPGSAKAPRRPGSAAAAQPFARYLAAELHPGPSYPTADVVWGQTERDRVYNALVAVPYQLERFLLFGVALCLDSFLVRRRGRGRGRSRVGEQLRAGAADLSAAAEVVCGRAAVSGTGWPRCCLPLPTRFDAFLLPPPCRRPSSRCCHCAWVLRCWPWAAAFCPAAAAHP